MKLVYPEVAGALCAKMDRGLSGQDAVNGMVCVLKTTPGGGVFLQHLTQVITKALVQGMGRSESSWQ